MKKAVLPAACPQKKIPSLSSPFTHRAALFVCVACSGAGGLPRGTTPLQPHLQPLHAPFQVTTILITTGEKNETTQKGFANPDRFPGSFGMGLEGEAAMMIQEHISSTEELRHLDLKQPRISTHSSICWLNTLLCHCYVTY